MGLRRIFRQWIGRFYREGRRERGCASPGCVRSRMIRIPKHSAGTLWLRTVAPPCPLPAVRRKLSVPLGCAPGFPAECKGLLNLLPKPQPELANPLSRRPSLQKITHTQNVTNSPHIILKRHIKSIKKTKIPIEIRPKLCYNITSKRKNLQ